MRFLTQTILNADPDWEAKGETPGNCFQTAIASWLDLDPADVPHFVAIPGWPNWWIAARNWARSLAPGLDFTYAPIDDPIIPVVRRQYTEGRFYEGNMIAGGVSPRGSSHAVVVSASNLELVWDPHPDRTGLTRIEELYWLCGTYDPSPEEQLRTCLEEKTTA